MTVRRTVKNGKPYYDIVYRDAVTLKYYGKAWDEQGNEVSLTTENGCNSFPAVWKILHQILDDLGGSECQKQS